jgi:tripartite-type tricarboxylate transporter receptor subunit TctC
MFAPAGTPKAIITELNKVLIELLHDKAVEKKIEEQGADVETTTPEELSALLKKEAIRWKKVVDDAKITVD